MLATVHSQQDRDVLVQTLLDKIDLEASDRPPRPGRKLRPRTTYIKFLHDLPAYDGLLRIGPDSGFAALKRIGKEENKQKRHLMASIVRRIFRKKVAVIYLEEQLSLVEADKELSAKEKDAYRSRIREAIVDVKQQEEDAN
jgi:hypothetical protein